MHLRKERFDEGAGLHAEGTGRTMRMFMMACEYGGSTVPLTRCAKLFGYSPDEASKRAARAALPVPAFRCGSQKSPWLVNVEDLANYLENQREQALLEWQKINGTHSPLQRG
jgi:hypothetical protein